MCLRLPSPSSIILWGGLAASVALVLVVASLATPPTAAQSDPEYAAYLPLMVVPLPPELRDPEPFGFETSPGAIAQSAVRSSAVELNASWVRLNTVSWREVQPEADTPVQDWNWDALSIQNLENELRVASELGLIPIVLVDDNPAWARTGDLPCTAIRADRFDDFARFVQELARRYSGPPYNAHYWELGNEPDVPPPPNGQVQPFGCWGDVTEEYYGGEHYGAMLNAVAPALRAVDPEVKIVTGGLLLDTPETTNPALGNPERFLEGILRAGAAANFDVVAFHGYAYYQGSRTVDADLANPKWESRGGIIRGKAGYVREVLARYNVEKPLFLNETGMLYYNNDAPPDSFLEAKADHTVRLFARAMFVDLQAVIWYTLSYSGWRGTSLLGSENEPRPAFTAYREFARQTRQSFDTVDISSAYDGLEAYRFTKTDGVVDVLWSFDATTIVVPVADFRAAYTRDGATLEPRNQSDTQLLFDVGPSPIYIQRR